jgi:hypothetical protein
LKSKGLLCGDPSPDALMWNSLQDYVKSVSKFGKGLHTTTPIRHSEAVKKPISPRLMENAPLEGFRNSEERGYIEVRRSDEG